MGTYRTLSFKTKKRAEKNEREISRYFGESIEQSQILLGKDERGNNGFYVEYSINHA